MKVQKSFFAVDLGATSGRTIVGTLADGQLHMEELTRFGNALIEVGGHFYWDIFALYNEIIGGLKLAAHRGIDIESIGIDTWGVDFVCIGSDGAIMRNPLSYRDPHTFKAIDHYFNHVKSRDEVYSLTGIQFMNFNSLFQLHAMRNEGNSALCEYTIASTSQMLDPRTHELAPALLASVGLEREKFGRMVMPGTRVGTLTEEVQRMTGLGPVPVVAVAGHDTGSAVAAVPARDEHFAYLSSGTWSLMGIETPDAVINSRSYELNFTNEGGVEGTTRFLKNICGMWLYERCRKEWSEEAKKASNQNDDSLSHAVLQAEAMHCRDTQQPVPTTRAEICRCIFDSLALRYRQVFEWLKEFSPVSIDVLHIIGGGSLNKYLNQMTADACEVRVLAGPQECTALGNIMMQAKACGLVNDIWEMRKLIASAIEMQCFEPTNHSEIWAEAYEKYLRIVGMKDER